MLVLVRLNAKVVLNLLKSRTSFFLKFNLTCNVYFNIINKEISAFACLLK